MDEKLQNFLPAHYRFLRTIQSRSDHGKQAINKLFPNDKGLQKNSLEYASNEALEYRLCYWCGVGYCKATSLERWQCRYHPGNLHEGVYMCCGQEEKKWLNCTINNYGEVNRSMIDIGCTPCIHMCLGKDIDETTLCKLRDAEIIPMSLLFTGVFNWPHESMLKNIVYGKEPGAPKDSDNRMDYSHIEVWNSKPRD